MKLSVRDINKTFVNNRVHTKVLEDISMDIDDGQFVCLLGPSGCGKTTLLTIIGGFQKSERGDVFINDKRVKKPGIDRAFIFQNYALFPWKTIRGNVLFPMKQQKIPKEKREEMLEELLVMSDLKGKELLMDEPLGAVDFQMRQNLQEELERIWIKKKITALMVTHDVDEAVYMSDRVIVMSRDKGRIIDDINIDIPRPRIRGSQKYEEYKNKLTDTLSKCYEV